MFDPMLVKPKCVWEAVFYFTNCKTPAENVRKFSKIEKNLPLPKHILALPNKWSNIQMDHPVEDVIFCKMIS